MACGPDGTQSSRLRDATRRTRDLLRSDLRGGAYPDQRLPAEETLMRQMQVSRAVIRGALALLRAEGLIDRVQGVGTTLVFQPQALTLEESQGVTDPDPAGLLGNRMHPLVLGHNEVPLPPPIARRLGVPSNAPGVRIDYLAVVDGRPYGMVTNYMRMPEAAQLAGIAFRNDYYSYLSDAGLHSCETTYLMEAAAADEIDAELLKVAIGAPIMVAEQALFNEAGEAFNYAFVRGRGDTFGILSRAGSTPAVDNRATGGSVAQPQSRPA